MSNFKNYGTQGVSNDVQFGKAGGRLVFANGVFSVISTSTGTTLGRLQIATPVEANDAVTLDTLTGAINHVYAKLDRTSTAFDTQLTQIKSAVSTLRLDEVSGGTYTATASDAGLTVASTGIVSTLVLGVAADGVSLKAVSTGTDANIHLIPQGAGAVVIGDGTDDGLIQPVGGHSLTIAGGDADTAGNVVLRGGHGTTPGHVEIHDLLDPVAPQDPATLASSTAALEAATKTILTGSIRASVGSFKEVEGDTVVMPVPAGTLLRLKVLIIAPFATGATITVKTSTSTLALPTSIDESQPGIYSVELLQGTAADEVSVAIETTGGTGAASLALEFIAA